MARISQRVINSVRLPGMRHGVKTKVEGTSPCVFDLRIAQLGIDFNQIPAQNFSAALDGVLGFGEERRASAEKHAIVGREAVIMKIVLGIVDHAVAWA